MDPSSFVVLLFLGPTSVAYLLSVPGLLYLRHIGVVARPVWLSPIWAVAIWKLISLADIGGYMTGLNQFMEPIFVASIFGVCVDALALGIAIFRRYVGESEVAVAVAFVSLWIVFPLAISICVRSSVHALAIME